MQVQSPSDKLTTHLFTEKIMEHSHHLLEPSLAASASNRPIKQSIESSIVDPVKISKGELVERVEKAISLDPYLSPYFGELYHRQKKFQDTLQWIAEHEGGLDKFSKSYEKYGIHAVLLDDGPAIRCFEWVPDVQSVSLVGDFNDWNRNTHVFTSLPFGKWELILKNTVIEKGSRIKLSIVTMTDEVIDRLSPWTTRAIQNPDTLLYESIYYPLEDSMPTPRTFTDPFNTMNNVHKLDLFIYEVHIGIASSEPKIASFREFEEAVLPRIVRLGYNCIQFMAIQEHAYYGSFGYQVTSFFAVSSRFGKPEEFQRLIQKAQSMGILCILDIVHSHASKNVLDGLNLFNGRDDCYFHATSTGRGDHPLWDSRLFNYGHPETLRFLLSNVTYWIDLFGLDGFRFDGITSLLYKHHGVNHTFGGYEEYFKGDAVDTEAINYLMLVNYMCKAYVAKYPVKNSIKDTSNGDGITTFPSAEVRHSEITRTGIGVITIAEDVSGMPTLCRPIVDGGIGFDYRLALSVPDHLIELLKHTRDEDWDIPSLVYTLTNRRYKEATIAYTECHDQALVGDKSLAFWLMDAAMYTDMSIHCNNVVIDRGVALHKLLRLLISTLAADAYLNFIGNEFGHPEWLDFPREGNQQSYWYARRQFNLADDPSLRYKFLLEFDAAMIHFLRERSFYTLCRGKKYRAITPQQDVQANHFQQSKRTSDLHDRLMNVVQQDSSTASTWDYGHILVNNSTDKIIIFVRGKLLFLFNFHPSTSYVNYSIHIPPYLFSKKLQAFKVVLNTDSFLFGGHERVRQNSLFPCVDASIQVYLPSRVAILCDPIYEINTN